MTRFMARGLASGRGFTLMEVMIAITVLSVIVTLIWGSFSTTIKARERVLTTQERYHQLRLALERVATEISMAYLSRHLSPDGRTKTLFVGESGGGADRLTFTALAHQRLYRDANESDQGVVSYYLESDPERSGVQNLMRREKSRVRDEDYNLDEDEGSAFVLAEDVAEFRLEYWDEEKKDWISEWDTTGIERPWRLPTRVRVHLALNVGGGDGGGKDRTLEATTMVKIFMSKPIQL